MTNTKTITILFAGIMLAAGILTLVPSASAQLEQQCATAAPASLSPGTVSAPEKIKPITGSGKISVTFNYEAQQSARSLAPIQVDLRAESKNPWTTVVVSPATAFIQIGPDNNQPVNKPVAVTATVTFSKDAPAFAKEEITIFAKAGPGTCVGPAQEVKAPTIIVADFYERYQARFEKTIFKTGQNSQVAIPLTLENLGNGDITVNFAIGEGTSKGLVLALPGQQILGSTISGAETGKLPVNIDVKTPFKNGYENRQDQLVIAVSGASADDTAQKLSTLQVSAVIQTQGVYVPGFGAVTMIAALLGGIFAVRRHR